jgi:formamidopyrimidine-DNA glycosylase
VPEGDTILLAARTLERALSGSPVVRFESAFPQITRVADENRVTGRLVESVSARGKHLLIAFSGGLVLRTHMRIRQLARCRRVMTVSVKLGRRTTRSSLDPAGRLWVYGRAGQPCFRCRTMILAKKTGPDARITYWCPSCQPAR